MDDDTKAIAVGLGAGLGGFAGLLIVGCVCWQIFCGSWCEKKQVSPKKISAPIKNQRHVTPINTVHTSVATLTPLKKTNVYPDMASSSSNDLAHKVKSTHR